LEAKGTIRKDSKKKEEEREFGEGVRKDIEQFGDVEVLYSVSFLEEHWYKLNSIPSEK
jgi:hypothetical protein